MGMLLFIVSEVMFFSLFWAFFYSSIAPAIEIGAVWPPKGIETFDAFKVPLLNTLILLTSGFAVTICHNTIIVGDRQKSIYSLALTIVLAIAFTAVQGYEYLHATFTISDGVFGSLFLWLLVFMVSTFLLELAFYWLFLD